ncbi:DUF4231 domain-containing protein [Kineosporia sp. J2-2]|uniref:DUF4231 domain-containing protein n=1 Tax=Kineosporia corallincola TaxID=2835133 RepID=A0ABS5TBN8_9ACTN|nr:DUF4231 domain-containing protein [Kineosporia corallincola]MBT0768502.1 DUF4231 domain-containing protein [Kineosporia corallincola]
MSRTLLTDDDMRRLVEQCGYEEILDQRARDIVRVKANRQDVFSKEAREASALSALHWAARKSLFRNRSQPISRTPYRHDPAGRRFRYREDVDALITNYRDLSRRGKRMNTVLQLTIIGGSAMATILTAASGEHPAVRWWAAGLSGVVSATAAVIAYFKPREHAHDQQSTADAIELERNQFDLGIGHYASLPVEEATREFTERVERAVTEQRQRELQMDQSTPDPSSSGQAR